jgi:ATP-binding cassette subfamily B protein
MLGAMALTIGMDVLRPWPVKLLVDQVLGHRPLPPGLERVRAAVPFAQGADGLLLWVVVGTLLIYAAGALASMVETTAAVRLGQRMVYDLGADLFLHVQRLSLAFHRRRPVGDTIARVTVDPYCVQALINSGLHPLLRSLGTLAAMFVVMWRLDPRLTVLSLLVTPFLVLTIRIFGESMRARHRRRRDLEGRMMSVVEQALSAIPAVQAFTREELEHARFRAHARSTAQAYLQAIYADTRFSLCVGLVTAAGTAAIMWVGAGEVLHGRMTVGTILVFLSYLGALYAPLHASTYTVSSMQSAAASAERIAELLDTPPDVRDGPETWSGRVQGRVRYEDVTFGYDPGRPVLRGVSFDASPGETVAIVGPTGAGKTTLLGLLLRFFDPWSGRVLIDGRDIRRLRVRALREQVAIVLQDPFIFPLTVAENIAYGNPEAAREDIIAAAAAAGADEFIRRLPDGYETVIGEKGATLSGGEKQRLSIARAFLKNAPILILDEPTSAMDLLTESRLLDAMERLARGRTTFIIAHRLSTVQRADRILVMDRGAIVEAGRHADLVAQNGLYARLHRRQTSPAAHEPRFETLGAPGDVADT